MGSRLAERSIRAHNLLAIYGSINVKIVYQYYAGTRSVYIQEGRQDKGRKTAPRAGARGLSHVRTPAHLWTPSHFRTPPYSDKKMVEDSGSELSELASSVVGMEVEEKWEGKSHGRPNFKRATSGAGQQQSTQDFFRHGGNDIFDTPGKSAMGGALARSLVAAASSAQEVEMAETRNSAKSFGQGVWKLDVEAVDWAEVVANEVEMEGVVDSERSRTPSPTPARWWSAAPAAPKGRTTPTPVLVTPTKGSKRMAMRTPRPNRLRRPALAHPTPIGFAAASALEQILAAVARVEKKMEEKVAALEARMMDGIGVLAAENEREVRMAAGLLADAEQREKRLAMKLLAMDGIKTELTQKGRCVTAGSGRAPGSGGRVVRRGGGRAVERGGGRAVERGGRRATEEDEDRTETRARDKDGDTDRDKDGDKDKDRDKTETRTETRTQ